MSYVTQFAEVGKSIIKKYAVTLFGLSCVFTALCSNFSFYVFFDGGFLLLDISINVHFSIQHYNNITPFSEGKGTPCHFVVFRATFQLCFS